MKYIFFMVDLLPSLLGQHHPNLVGGGGVIAVYTFLVWSVFVFAVQYEKWKLLALSEGQRNTSTNVREVNSVRSFILVLTNLAACETRQLWF